MPTAAEMADYGLDSSKPVVTITQTGLRLKEFFRSLRSDKITNPKAVKLVWRTGKIGTPVSEYATVRILVESMTQIYLWAGDPHAEDPDEDDPYGEPDWQFTGRLETGEGFDPSPEAQCTRVRGFIAASVLLKGEVDFVILQVVDGSLELPADQ